MIDSIIARDAMIASNLDFSKISSSTFFGILAGFRSYRAYQVSKDKLERVHDLVVGCFSAGQLVFFSPWCIICNLPFTIEVHPHLSHFFKMFEFSLLRCPSC